MMYNESHITTLARIIMIVTTVLTKSFSNLSANSSMDPIQLF
jgi:hypothetical protein